jgi:hypothetical protein
MSETALAPMTGPRGVALRDTADIERFATIVYKSTLVPKEYRNNLADVFGIIAFGMELGLNPMQSIQNIAFINSKPSVYGDMLLGLVEASGLLESFDEVDPDEAFRTGVARCTLKRRGRPPITRTFTREMAETAKLWTKDIWRAYPGRMLQMRARSWALRDAFSDVLKGLYAREEAEDIVLTMDSKGTYQAFQAQPEREESTIPIEALPGQMDSSVEGHPTADQINNLVELIRVCGLDVSAHMHEILGLPPDVKMTKKIARETMSMTQYDTAWLFYSDKLKDDDQDVQDFSGPESTQTPQDDLRVVGEGPEMPKGENVEPGGEEPHSEPTPVSDASEHGADLDDLDEAAMEPEEVKAHMESLRQERDEAGVAGSTAQTTESPTHDANLLEAQAKLRAEASTWGILASEIEHVISHHPPARARNILWTARRPQSDDLAESQG